MVVVGSFLCVGWFGILNLICQLAANCGGLTCCLGLILFRLGYILDFWVWCLVVALFEGGFILIDLVLLLTWCWLVVCVLV